MAFNNVSDQTHYSVSKKNSKKYTFNKNYGFLNGDVLM